MNEVTHLLDRVQGGDRNAATELLPLVYEELRQMAAQKMARENPGHTLQPTALVHEAWLRLVGDETPQFVNRSHFFGAAAEAMRRILVENARRKSRLKHGGQFERVDLESLDLAVESTDDQVLAVDAALDKLALRDPVGAQLIKLRFFVGLPNVEAARLLGLSERTAKRVWSYARAWLFEELKKSE